MKMPLHIKYVLLLILCAALSACKRSDSRYVIGVSQCSSDEWRQKMNDEMLREALFYKNVRLDIRTAHDDNKRQAVQIDSLAAAGVDIIIAAPSEAEALTPAIERAYRQGIPVVLVDRKILSPHFTAFVGADNYTIGRDAGTLIAGELPQGGRVIEFLGSMRASAGAERHAGFTDALRGKPSLHVSQAVDAGWDGARIDQQVDSLIAQGIVPDMVFAHTDRTGVKVQQAFARHGRKVRVVGVDGLATPGGGLEMVEKGKLAASFVYPTGGDKVIQTAMSILNHRPFQRENLLNSAVITSSTARIIRMQNEQISQSEERIDMLNSQVDHFLSRYSMQKMLVIALAVIMVLVIVVLAVGMRAYFSARAGNKLLLRQKTKLENQRDQLVTLSKELEESTRSKLAFFTEVSHDLRTPLTLITAPVEQLEQKANLDTEERDLLAIIRTNADILLRLVGQTLDFSKFEAGHLELSVRSTDLAAALTKWCTPFRALAVKKMVRFNLRLPSGSDGEALMAEIDETKMESVVYNLLSNAFKFTPEGGSITVSLSQSNDAESGRRAIVSVQDSGRGIDSDKIVHVFERFYQTDVSHEGSGIGLATAKAYVELHGGVIRAESVKGKGACFSFSIPCKQSSAASDTAERLRRQQPEEADTDKSAESPAHVEAAPNIPPSPSALPTSATTEPAEVDQQPTLLVIDDNADIRNYIRLLLGSDYAIVEAENGRDGLSKALQAMPDAVICDVMMPVMDGWECCRRIKDEWQTSHIPVMMLTACAMDEQRIAGFDCGADAYISKPFSPEVLRSRLRNLIANRRRMRSFFAEAGTTERDGVSELDKGFAERFRRLIEKNMGNPDLNVEDLAGEMGLGRSQLYRKLKSLTGYTPIELIRVARLKRAAELLTRGEKTVAEIAYEVGFSTPGYMAKCFRDFYGMNPTEYAAERGAK